MVTGLCLHTNGGSSNFFHSLSFRVRDAPEIERHLSQLHGSKDG